MMFRSSLLEKLGVPRRRAVYAPSSSLLTPIVAALLLLACDLSGQDEASQGEKYMLTQLNRIWMDLQGAKVTSIAAGKNGGLLTDPHDAAAMEARTCEIEVILYGDNPEQLAAIRKQYPSLLMRIETKISSDMYGYQ